MQMAKVYAPFFIFFYFMAFVFVCFLPNVMPSSLSFDFVISVIFCCHHTRLRLSKRLD